MTGSWRRSAGSCPGGAASSCGHSIVAGLREALGDGGGVAAQRRGALERLHLLLEDWRVLRARLADTEERMTGRWMSWA